MKSGFVAIIGRTNVGKSTILNAILKTKLSIVTDKSQTTRNNIRGIYNADGVQIVFVDTPGIHKPFKKLGTQMNSMAYSASHDVEAVVLVVDASVPYGKGDDFLQERLSIKCPLFIVFNKIDQTDILKMEKLKDQYRQLFPEAQFVETVATEKVNIDLLLKRIIAILPEGPQYYPADVITDRDLNFRISEIIREKILKILKEEVPHCIAVQVASYEDKGKDIIIRANILVEKDSQKAIVIGRGGTMIKKIGTHSRREIEQVIKKHVYLELFVKVKESWRDDERLLSELGYIYKK
ncbi:MAG: GTPase Era [Erysipelotrichia bacterium]|jgi:GTP-binding protein Era|nr:GTPase Era [Bacilli bacterium]NLB49857.1 GTPase Era [Erysipelotrichia bacterium]